MTEGFALGFAWTLFLVFLGLLVYFLLRDQEP
jgi:hypothetical protein